jgi:hypothetical protein
MLFFLLGRVILSEIHYIICHIRDDFHIKLLTFVLVSVLVFNLSEAGEGRFKKPLQNYILFTA